MHRARSAIICEAAHPSTHSDLLTLMLCSPGVRQPVLVEAVLKGVNESELAAERYSLVLPCSRFENV
jgi:hypothetical protein